VGELLDEIAGARETALFELLRLRLQREAAVASPAAGADWSIPVPAGAYWEPLAIVATLTTSAVVANRGPRVIANDGGIAFASLPSPVSATASAAWRFTWAHDGVLNQSSPAGTGVMQAIPDLIVPGGGSLSVATNNLDVADQWSAIVVTVREWSPTAVRAALKWLEDHYR
jgi:hypothetical protein